MCQAKITDHYGGKYKCLRPDSQILDIKITYAFGHKKGRIRQYTRTLCSKHAKTMRYNLNTRRKKGHEIIVTLKNLIPQQDEN
jgi:hypothetical protein